MNDQAPQTARTNLLSVFRGTRYSWWVIVIFAILGAISLVAVYSATEGLAYRIRDGNTFYYLRTQLLMLSVGLASMFFVQLLPRELLRGFSAFGLIFSLVLLLLTLFTGADANNARRWISIMGKRITTADIVRVPVLIYLAAYISAKQDVIKSFSKGVLMVALILGAVCFLVSSSLLTSLIFALTGAAMLLMGRVRFIHILGVGLVGALALGLGMMLKQSTGIEDRSDTHRSRIENFWAGTGDQALKAKMAVANGTFLGQGVGDSKLRSMLPESHNDFIYAVIIEESGLLGMIAIPILYLLLVLAIYQIATLSPNLFDQLLCAGVALSIGLQAFFHMLITVGLLPVTGVPLPLVSVGGSSIIATGAALGLVLRVSHDVRETEAKS